MGASLNCLGIRNCTTWRGSLGIQSGLRLNEWNALYFKAMDRLISIWRCRLILVTGRGPKSCA